MTPEALTMLTPNLEPIRFEGPSYDDQADKARLTGQLARIFLLMKDGEWRTLDEIAGAVGAPAASVSAQLRHLRKPRFGGHTVEKQRRGDRDNGLFEYRVVPAVRV